MKDRQKACLFAFVLAASAIPAAHASPSLTGGRTPSATPSVASCARAHPSIRVTPSSNAQRGGRQGSSVALITYGAATVALVAYRWTERLSALPWVRAFRTGMAPITIGLLLATGWVLAAPNAGHPVLIGVTAVTAALVLLTRLNPLWLLAGGALAGILSA